ncbi:MAG: 6-hydroxymethylpterin diphosphokinase MptE-like protein [Chloroherpetonaceae bacterium]|nr:6-hydroxymethylpterin diphosphokinase MptE-like protein [Chloroherpetonaceae bacterium]
MKFHNLHKNQQCIIIGNGPSLSKVDMNIFKSVTTFGVNKIFLLYPKTLWRPTYHFFLDPYVIRQSYDAIQKYKNDSSFFLNFDNVGDLYKREPSFYYYRSQNVLGFNKFLPSMTVSDGQSVTYVVLQFAYIMGFKTVYLFGIDHNHHFVSNTPSKEIITDSHPKNHFDPNYFETGQVWWKPDKDYIEMAYRLAKFFYERDDRKIYDCTINGNLNIFEKMDYQEALLRIHQSH